PADPAEPRRDEDERRGERNLEREPGALLREPPREHERDGCDDDHGDPGVAAQPAESLPQLRPCASRKREAEAGPRTERARESRRLHERERHRSITTRDPERGQEKRRTFSHP